MKRQLVTSMGSLSIVIAAALLAPASAAEQPGAVPRLADGHPDLQGVWDYRTITPMQRPLELGTKEFFASDEEAAAWERSENRRQDRDAEDLETGGETHQPGDAPFGPKGGVPPGWAGGGGGVAGRAAYNEFWWDRGNKIVGTKRTSLIVDPPNGRYPAMTPEGQKRADLIAAARNDTNLGRPHADSYEDRPLAERCILGFNSGPPMTPGAYNNNVELFQAPGYVAIVNEMIHDTRIVPLDGRPHGHVPLWRGDSRGHWEGDTLVVDTINFKRETSFPNSGANLHLVEKFTRTDADTLTYEFTIDDPSVWTRPFTAVVPMRKSDQPIYEYACHEGNYAMASILAGARAAEKAAEAKASK
jgi:hypothetical protein